MVSPLVVPRGDGLDTRDLPPIFSLIVVDWRAWHEESLRRLGQRDRERISAAIGALLEGDVKLLRGPERLWRLCVGEWRVILIVGMPNG